MHVVVRRIVGIFAIAVVLTVATPMVGSEAERPTAEVVSVDAESGTLTLREMNGRVTTYTADAGFIRRLEAGERIGYEAENDRIVTIVRVGTKPRLDLK